MGQINPLDNSIALLAENTLEQRVVGVIAPSLAQLGYEVVRVKVMESGRRKILQIMLDCADGRNIVMSDCEKASRQISSVLDVDDPITERYDLEVSSPGIDRPLTRLKDFERFKGLEAKVEAREKINGRRRFKGRLGGVENGEVLVTDLVEAPADKPEEASVRIPFSQIQSAKLILTDELLSLNQESL